MIFFLWYLGIIGFENSGEIYYFYSIINKQTSIYLTYVNMQRWLALIYVETVNQLLQIVAQHCSRCSEQLAALLWVCSGSLRLFLWETDTAEGLKWRLSAAREALRKADRDDNMSDSRERPVDRTRRGGECQGCKVSSDELSGLIEGLNDCWPPGNVVRCARESFSLWQICRCSDMNLSF